MPGNPIWKNRKNGGRARRGAYKVAADDRRSPLRRVLESAASRGNAFPDYSQQWRVIWRAHRLGFLTDGSGSGYMGQITDAGRAWLADPTNH